MLVVVAKYEYCCALPVSVLLVLVLLLSREYSEGVCCSRVAAVTDDVRDDLRFIFADIIYY